MIYIPPLRRFFLPTIIFVACFALYFSLPLSRKLPSIIPYPPLDPPRAFHISQSTLQYPLLQLNSSLDRSLPVQSFFHDGKYGTASIITPNSTYDANPQFASLFRCTQKPNRHIGHVRLSNILLNVSQIPSIGAVPEKRVFWNPTIIALPYWSPNQYLVVSRIVTDGNHQENILCEANVCYVPGTSEAPRSGEEECTAEDLKILGPAGGMRCAHAPITLSVPPTPAERCDGDFVTYADIPGFHDPRIFWSGKGEPLMMVNTQSRYACFGLWIVDLRSLYAPLERLLSGSPTNFIIGGPLKSYQTLTELTRNPADTRATIEKNWFFFSTALGESYIHYDLPAIKGSKRGRTFAKLLGNGLTTPNLTDPHEAPCLQEADEHDQPDPTKRGRWHQATNALRLILCNRGDPSCKAQNGNQVFFALIHRKLNNELGLPMRYERFFMVWESSPPFRMIGITKYPLLMANETVLPYSPKENWDDDGPADNSIDQSNEAGNTLKRRFERVGERSINDTMVPATSSSKGDGRSRKGKPRWANFTYTVSISYAWGRAPRGIRSKGDESEDMHVGFLDDAVLLAIGVDDAGQVFARVRAEKLVNCLNPCPA